MKLETVNIKGQVSETIENKVDFLLTVPCSILRSYLDFSGYENTETIFLSREEEGVGLAAGLSITGKNVVLAMQNSGFGNCINAFASLAKPYKIGFIVILSIRGDKFETNSVQNPLGQATRVIIKSLDLSYVEVTKTLTFSEAFNIAEAGIKEKNEPFFILLPRLEALK